ncbi:MAG: DUF305 domain-containing protein [Saprospiraceae bacterium]|nr:DUF305 domain-containing protein [Saprospiraceae bacterium]
MTLLKLLLWLICIQTKNINSTKAAIAIITIITAFVILRKPTLIQDVQFMKAIIPHHSSAIIVSQNATFEDPETIQLAKDTIQAQKREIAQMEAIIKRLQV